MWVSFEITNPEDHGNFPISVETFNGNNNLIDYGETLINIGDTIA